MKKIAGFYSSGDKNSRLTRKTFELVQEPICILFFAKGIHLEQAQSSDESLLGMGLQTFGKIKSLPHNKRKKLPFVIRDYTKIALQTGWFDDGVYPTTQIFYCINERYRF